MILIPAIDLHDGQCVQLQRGLLDSASVYSDDPPSMATHWAALGARRIHVVDLDGAFDGKPRNSDLVRGIVDAADGVPVEVGGGIRSFEVIEAYLEVGVSQVIVGTQAVEDPEFMETAALRYPDRTILGLDARSGLVATRGWGETSELHVDAVVERFESLPIFAIVYTDIDRDGMLSGVNVDATAALARRTNLPLIASGGVKSLEDLRLLAQADVPGKNFLGAITGSAIYERTLDFAAGQRLLDDLAG